jgi:hypothetical protein
MSTSPSEIAFLFDVDNTMTTISSPMSPVAGKRSSVRALRGNAPTR